MNLSIREIQLTEKDIWDCLVKSSDNGCFMQSWDWANFKELEGYKTFRYGLFLDKNVNSHLVGGCIYYLYTHTNNTNFITAPGAPILPDINPELGMKLLLDKAVELGKNIGAIGLRIEPLWTHKPNYLNGFVRAAADLLPSETLVVDLRRDLSEILSQMKPKGRYNIQLSHRHQVITEFTTNSQAIPTFYDLFWETVKRQEFFGEPYSFFINLCQTLFTTNMAEIGFAKYQGQILAAILVVYYGKTATYLYGGRSIENSQVMANYGLHWAAMERAKMRGCHFYDFYGFTRSPNHNYAKFSQFKSQFGGSVVTSIGAHDYFFYDQLADTLINLFRSIY
jgi:peptidoglycan pentaglycine glycine transferase (the first glycine)